jgi:heme/copper-type cytochrome/quinol oxidase subunit 3
MDNTSTVDHVEYEVEDYTGPAGTTAGRLGVWILISSEITIFAGLLGSYILFRIFHPEWSEESAHLNIVLGTINTILLLSSNFFMMKAASAVEQGNQKKSAKLMLLTIALGLAFLVVKGFEYAAEFSHGEFPSTSTFWSFYFLLTGLHGTHILGGVIAIGILWAHAKNDNLGELKGRVALTGLYWSFVEVVWIFLFPLLYLLREGVAK